MKKGRSRSSSLGYFKAPPDKSGQCDGQGLVGLVFAALIGAIQRVRVEHDSEVALRRAGRQRTSSQRADVRECVTVLEFGLRNDISDETSGAAVQAPIRTAARSDVRQDLSSGNRFTRLRP